jgi:hypothetical protein
MHDWLAGSGNQGRSNGKCLSFNPCTRQGFSGGWHWHVKAAAPVIVRAFAPLSYTVVSPSFLRDMACQK